MSYFKVLVIGMLLKNNDTASFGDVVSGDRFTDSTDKLINEGFIEKSNKRKESKAGDAEDAEGDETDFDKSHKAAVQEGLDNLKPEAADKNLTQEAGAEPIKETPVQKVETKEAGDGVKVDTIEEPTVTKVKTTAPEIAPVEEKQEDGKGPDATKIFKK